MKRTLQGFGLDISRGKCGPIISFWSLSLVHILQVLRERVETRHVLVYTGPYTVFRKSVLSLSEMMQVCGLTHKKHRSGCVSIPGNRFVAGEKRLRRDLSGGRFEFIDTVYQPPYAIYKGFTRRAIQFTEKSIYTVGKIPDELGSTFNCHLRDNDMGAVAVRRRDEPLVIGGCLEQMFRREGGRLKIDRELLSEPFSPIPLEIVRRLCRLSRAQRPRGITVVRKDIRIDTHTLVAPCWLGYPERDCHFEEMFVLKYSLVRRTWWMGPVRAARYPYSGVRLKTDFKLFKPRKS